MFNYMSEVQYFLKRDYYHIHMEIKNSMTYNMILKTMKYKVNYFSLHFTALICNNYFL